MTQWLKSPICSPSHQIPAHHFSWRCIHIFLNTFCWHTDKQAVVRTKHSTAPLFFFFSQLLFASHLSLIKIFISSLEYIHIHGFWWHWLSVTRLVQRPQQARGLSSASSAASPPPLSPTCPATSASTLERSPTAAPGATTGNGSLIRRWRRSSLGFHWSSHDFGSQWVRLRARRWQSRVVWKGR